MPYYGPKTSHIGFRATQMGNATLVAEAPYKVEEGSTLYTAGHVGLIPSLGSERESTQAQTLIYPELYRWRI